MRHAGKYSEIIFTKTGVHGAHFELLFYSNCVPQIKGSIHLYHLQNISDDTAFVGLIGKGNDQALRDVISSFVTRSDSNFLELNVGKTK